MTWYRVGPAGIPGSLKTDMDAVLNKKFGTSTTYAPNTWPDNVNLLGPLPEKTASGAIANITDGADGVPLKNWLITLPASLDGYTEVNGTKAGKNLFNKSAVEIDKYLDTTTGLPVPAVNYVVSDYIPVFSGVTIFIPASWTARRWFYDKDKTPTTYLNNSLDQAYTPSADGYIRVSILKTQINLDTYQIEYGSTATAYEPYEAPTQYTASLGRTIYGGTADIVTGEGEDDRLKYELDENDSWSAYGGATHSFWHNVASGEDRPIDQTKLTQCICNELTYSTTAPASAPDFTFMVQGGQRIVVTADSSIDTVDKFKTWILSHNLVFVCPAAAPENFTFTPITPTPETALGVNNFWADEGDSDVTYRADIQLALNA